MKILYIVPYIPSLIRVRPYNLIRFLSANGNQVTVAALQSSSAENNDIIELQDQCYAVHTSAISKWRSYVNSLLALPTRSPLQAVFSWSPSFTRLLDEIDPNAFDVIHVEHLRGVRYGLYLKETYPHIPVVWDSVDCISLLFRWASQRSRSFFGRWLTRFELSRTERYEAGLLSHFDRVLVTSPIDKQALLDLAGITEEDSNVQVLTNGVDLGYFHPDDSIQRDPATVVISGKMSYHANITMVLYLAEEIMPLVWAEKPDVRLEIVGKDPSPEIQNLGENGRVDVVGSVPDLRPYLQKATIAAAPILYGVGIQNKVLEAMACATPVIATPQAVSAIDAQAGADVMVGESPADFAAHILELLRDPAKREQIGRSGRRFVEEHHQWTRLAKDLEQIYEQAQSKKQGESTS